jgi:hypothetical protein
MANSHTSAQRAFIVRRLAAFEPPRAIVLDFMALFPDTRCDENDVRALNPETGALVSPELFELFKKERERVLLDPSSAPFVEQKARMIMLSNHAKFHNSNNELATARGVLRQIAEELGAVGGGKAPGKGSSAGSEKPGEPIVVIERRIVDPKPPEPVE